MLGKLTRGRSHEHRAERSLQTGEHRLGLRVTESSIELHHPGATGGEGQPHVQHSDKGGAALVHLPDRGQGHSLQHILDQPGAVLIEPRQRAVGAHASGVGPLVVIQQAFEVLRRLQRSDVRAVGEAKKRHFRSVEELLDDHCSARCGQTVQPVSQRFIKVLGDHDPFATGQSIVFDHVGRHRGVQGVADLLGCAAHLGTGGGHVGGGHHFFGEGFAALESGRRSARTQAREAGGADRVGDPSHQGSLWADDDQVDGVLGGYGDHDAGVSKVADLG